MHCLIVLWPGSVAVRWCSPPPGGSVVAVPLRADHLLKFAFRQVDEARARIAWMDITARYPSCGIMSTGKARGLRQFPLFTPLPPSRGKPTAPYGGGPLFKSRQCRVFLLVSLL